MGLDEALAGIDGITHEHVEGAVSLGGIIDVLGRSPFRAKYHIEPEDITALVNLIRLRGELVVPERKVTLCRDPKDDKFLEAALAGNAEVVVSGDSAILDAFISISRHFFCTFFSYL